MTPAALHTFLLTARGTCFDGAELVRDLQCLGRMLKSEWGELALKRQDEAGKLVSGWIAELERDGLVKVVGGKWVGVPKPVEVKEREIQKGLF
jgi:hypothetical protein